MEADRTYSIKKHILTVVFRQEKRGSNGFEGNLPSVGLTGYMMDNLTNAL